MKMVSKKLRENQDYQCLLRYYQRYDLLVDAESDARKKGNTTDIMRATSLRLHLQKAIRELEDRLNYAR